MLEIKKYLLKSFLMTGKKIMHLNRKRGLYLEAFPFYMKDIEVSLKKMLAFL